jgi:hydroxymethylpyrimidine pyrophosphatase-like HAD family hydrolase
VDPLEVAAILRDFDIKVEATGFAVHLVAPDHSKMKGLRKAAELLDIQTDEILAIGDSDNDVSMISGCGMGVALANASPAAKEAATYVTEAEHSEGVREALQRFQVIS